MMVQVHQIETSLFFDDETSLAQIVLLQWHTPLNGIQALDAEVTARRTTFFDSFAIWFQERMADHNKLPIVLTPEIALPRSLIPNVDQLES